MDSDSVSEYHDSDPDQIGVGLVHWKNSDSDSDVRDLNLDY